MIFEIIVEVKAKIYCYNDGKVEKYIDLRKYHPWQGESRGWAKKQEEGGVRKLQQSHLKYEASWEEVFSE